MKWSLVIASPVFNGGEAVRMTSADLLTAEEELAWTIAGSNIAHAEYPAGGIDPTHCPGCRNGIAVTALVSRSDPTPDLDPDARVGRAAAVVALMTRSELLACFEVTRTDESDDEEPDPQG